MLQPGSNSWLGGKLLTHEEVLQATDSRTVRSAGGSHGEASGSHRDTDTPQAEAMKDGSPDQKSLMNKCQDHRSLSVLREVLLLLCLIRSVFLRVGF